MKESPFFAFLNRRDEVATRAYLEPALEEVNFIDWNGYILVQDYGDAEAEYHAIRDACALFDVSPLRKYRITGVGAGPFLDRLLTRPVSDAPCMRGMYVIFCNDDGSLKDDVSILGLEIKAD